MHYYDESILVTAKYHNTRETIDKTDVEDRVRLHFSASIEIPGTSFVTQLPTEPKNSDVTDVFAYGSLAYVFSSLRGLPSDISVPHFCRVTE